MVALQTNPPADSAGMHLPIPQSPVMAAGALVLAFGLHVSFAFFTQTTPVEQAGGNTALAAQGNSFANLAEGVETPEFAREQPPEQEVQQPVAQMPVELPQVVAVQPVQPKLSETIEAAAQIQAVEGGVPVIVVPAITLPVELPSEPVLSVSPPENTTAVELETLPVSEPVEQQEVAKPEAAKPEVTRTEQVVPSQVQTQIQTDVQPPEPQSQPVLQSLRPSERPKRPAPEPVRQTLSKPAPTPLVAKPRGNSEVNATQGVATSTGTQTGGQAQTVGGTATVQGNAAADNYPGQVMRRIQRAKRVADVRGVAIVRFSIAASGGLAAVRLARSSGSGKLDGIALAQVRRAAPFPPPPAGAKRSFAVRIKGN
ncbi:TonB family protein [Pseudophaeobacter sp.]|uniref:TonB family protein n=1 Tax=Pseudophaeobacter sp. TaxID=1971739 RepID=UPI0040585947